MICRSKSLDRGSHAVTSAFEACFCPTRSIQATSRRRRPHPPISCIQRIRSGFWYLIDPIRHVYFDSLPCGSLTRVVCVVPKVAHTTGSEARHEHSLAREVFHGAGLDIGRKRTRRWCDSSQVTSSIGRGHRSAYYRTRRIKDGGGDGGVLRLQAAASVDSVMQRRGKIFRPCFCSVAVGQGWAETWSRGDIDNDPAQSRRRHEESRSHKSTESWNMM